MMSLGGCWHWLVIGIAEPLSNVGPRRDLTWLSVAEGLRMPRTMMCAGGYHAPFLLQFQHSKHALMFNTVTAAEYSPLAGFTGLRKLGRATAADLARGVLLLLIFPRFRYICSAAILLIPDSHQSHTSAKILAEMRILAFTAVLRSSR